MSSEIRKTQQAPETPQTYWSYMEMASSWFDSAKSYLGSIVFSEEDPLDEIDCTIREQALLVLGLSEEQAQNEEILEQRYQQLCKEWTTRIQRAESSEPLREKFEQMLSKAQRAYDTLKKGNSYAITKNFSS